jgi:hypothetical protein
MLKHFEPDAVLGGEVVAPGPIAEIAGRPEQGYVASL